MHVRLKKFCQSTCPWLLVVDQICHLVALPQFVDMNMMYMICKFSCILISSYDLTEVLEEEESKDGSEKLSRTESSKSFESFGEEVLMSLTLSCVLNWRLCACGLCRIYIDY